MGEARAGVDWQDRLTRLRYLLLPEDDLEFAEALSVSPVTLRAWLAGEDHPCPLSAKVIELTERVERMRIGNRLANSRAARAKPIDIEEMDYWSYLQLWAAHIRSRSPAIDPCEPSPAAGEESLATYQLRKAREGLVAAGRRFPLDELAERHKLRDHETTVLAALTVAELARPKEWTPRRRGWGARDAERTGFNLLMIVGGSPERFGDLSRLLAPEATLRARHLIAHGREAATILDAKFRLSGRTAAQALGGIPEGLLRRKRRRA